MGVVPLRSHADRILRRVRRAFPCGLGAPRQTVSVGVTEFTTIRLIGSIHVGVQERVELCRGRPSGCCHRGLEEHLAPNLGGGLDVVSPSLAGSLDGEEGAHGQCIEDHLHELGGVEDLPHGMRAVDGGF